MSRHIFLLSAVGLGSYFTGTLLERRKHSEIDLSDVSLAFGFLHRP